MQSNSDFCLFPGLGLYSSPRSPPVFDLPLLLPLGLAALAWLAFGSQHRLLLHGRRSSLRLGRLRLHSLFSAGLHSLSHARANQHSASIRPHSTPLKGVARIVLLSSELRGFAPSRDTSDLISHEAVKGAKKP